MKVYQVVKVEGVGVMECPYESTPIPEEVYTWKEAAEKRADQLWLENTSKTQRESGWCYLHYDVREIDVIVDMNNDI